MKRRRLLTNFFSLPVVIEKDEYGYFAMCRLLLTGGILMRKPLKI
jgi:hypothetical protein